jgi:hypothetical protein
MALVTITLEDIIAEDGCTTRVTVVSDPSFPSHEDDCTTAQVVAGVLMEQLNLMHELSEKAHAELPEVQESN